MQERFDLLNLLAEQFKLESYLEIGVQDKANNYNHIKVRRKVGVDPDPQALADFEMTSDAYFLQNKNKFDLIFIDGLHHADQVKKDFENALECLTDKGFIVLHDSLPDHEQFTTVPRATKKWFGDVYRFVMILRSYPGISYMVVKFDCGCTVVWKNDNFVLKDNLKIPDHVIDNITWQYYETNKNTLPLVNAESSVIIRKIKGVTESDPKEINMINAKIGTPAPSAQTGLASKMDAQKPATQEQFHRLEQKMDLIINLLNKWENESVSEGTASEDVIVFDEKEEINILEETKKYESALESDFENLTGERLDSFS